MDLIGLRFRGKGVWRLWFAWALLFSAAGLFAQTNTVKFYLEPALVPDAEAAKRALGQYVEDINTILGKNTERRLRFDPDSGIILTNSKPHCDCSLVLPRLDFEVWVHATKSLEEFSWDGYAGADLSGAGVLAGLKWARVHDPSSLEEGSAATEDYWKQISTLIHEFCHLFGAGIGEYYDLASVDDDTKEEPNLTVKLLDPGDPGAINEKDPFWGRHRDFWNDPLLRQIRPRTRQEGLQTVRLSDLTAAILNGGFRWPDARPPLPDLHTLRVAVVRESDQRPVTGARVRVWRVKQNIPTQLVFEGATDESGEMVFDWLGNLDSVFTDKLRLIKIAKDGFLPAGAYISVYDLQKTALLSANSEFTQVIPLAERKIALEPAGPGALRIFGAATDRYLVLQASGDLAEWTTILTNVPSGDPFVLEDAAWPRFLHRFYRVLERPDLPPPRTPDP